MPNFKQATDGDADGNRPGMTEFRCPRQIRCMWAALSGTSKEGAMQSYVDLVNRLVEQDQ